MKVYDQLDLTLILKEAQQLDESPQPIIFHHKLVHFKYKVSITRQLMME